MSSLYTRKKTILWASAAISVALVLTGCSQTATSAPAETAVSSAALSSPSASVTPEASDIPPVQAALETHTIANGYFQIQMPSNWHLEMLDNVAGQVHGDSTASFKILAADGRQLAELRTGGEQIWGVNPMPGRANNTVFDTAGDGTFGSLNYAFLSYDGQPDTAEVVLTSLGTEATKTWDIRLPGLIYTGGSGNLSTALTNATMLPGVSESLRGAERFKAYARTNEYSDLKNTFLSFKQLKDVVKALPEAAPDGKCIGLQYSYDLGESGLTCDEAKNFLTQLLQEPIHAGTAGIDGVGYCTLPVPEKAGYCHVESTNASFDFSVK